MSFLAPAFLWGLLLAAPLIAVYLLKVRPRRQQVTALFLWEKVFVEKRTSSLFRRLRDVLSLLLLAAALLALIFAAARPRPANADLRDLVIVLDHSASMQSSVSAGTTRLDIAKEEAKDLVAALSGGRRGAVFSISDVLEMRSFLTTDRRALRQAVDSVQPTPLPSDVSALMSLEHVSVFSDRVRVILISDAVGGAIELPTGIERLTVGRDRPGRNAGFIAADMLRDASGRLTVMFQLAGTDEVEGQRAEVELRHDGRVIKIVPVDLRAGVNERVITTSAGDPGRYELHLAFEDERTLDNVARLVARQAKPLGVWVSGEARFFFENAVVAFERSEGLFRLVDESESPELALVYGSDRPAREPRLGAVAFAPEAGTPWAESVGDVLAAPIPRLVAADHPAFRYVPVETLAFPGARAVTLPEGAAVLVEDQFGNPLVWQRRGAGTSAIVFNMNPADGDFFLSPYFPLVVRGAATHLGGRGDEPRAAYATGDEIDIPGRTPGERVELAVPGSPDSATAVTLRAQVRELGPDQRLRFDRAGFYAVSTSTGTWDLAANATSRDEVLEGVVAAGADPIGLPSGRPMWEWLAMLALAVLVLEEVLYHRRKVG